MGDHDILSYVQLWSKVSFFFFPFMDIKQMVANLQPGDRLDIDEIPLDKQVDFLDEFEGQGYLLSTEGRVGFTEECSACGGTGELDGAQCGCCEGFCLLESYGHGWAPYRG